MLNSGRALTSYLHDTLMQSGKTALLIACENRHVSTVAALIDAGADVNMKDNVSTMGTVCGLEANTSTVCFDAPSIFIALLLFG